MQLNTVSAAEGWGHTRLGGMHAGLMIPKLTLSNYSHIAFILCLPVFWASTRACVTAIRRSQRVTKQRDTRMSDC